MCQLNAYLSRKGQEELLQEDVTFVEVEGHKVLLTTLFEHRQAIDARIRVVDLVQNKLLLAANDSEETKQMTEKTEEQKLVIRLQHWIEHNTAHAREFQQAAKKARDVGHRAVHDEIRLAAEKLSEASEHLRNATDKLRH
jgi:predicted RNA-binding protein